MVLAFAIVFDGVLLLFLVFVIACCVDTQRLLADRVQTLVDQRSDSDAQRHLKNLQRDGAQFPYERLRADGVELRYAV
jgi:hypothetical protein